MADLTVLVPTRGRVQSSVRLFQAFRETCTADTELIFVISADDPAHDDYYWALTQAGSRAITVEVDKPGVVAPLNAGFDALKGSLGPFIGFMGDDHLPKTSGWDSELLKELKSLKTGIAYGNDLLQGENLPTAVFMTTDIPNTLGFMVPPTLSHFYLDNVWLDWGRGIEKIAYRDDVIIEHLHPANGKSRQDAIYRLSKPLLTQDESEYAAYKEKSLSGDLKALNGLLEEKPKPAPKKAPVKRAPAAKKTAPRKAVKPSE